MDITSLEYKRAFEEYIRRGTPVPLTLKQQQRSTTHYIWRTRGDGKVRPEHAANDGKVFAWDNPPPTGHPGEDYGCRCRAEPYEPSVVEKLDLNLKNVHDTGPAWTDNDFFHHYMNGGGKSIDLRETGHLVRIVNRYMVLASESLKIQIANEARLDVGSYFNYTFVSVYPMKSELFSLGDTTIGGLFYGTSHSMGAAIEIEGDMNFFLRDKFEDPLDIGLELPGSEWYFIMDKWRGTLEGEILRDPDQSIYK